MSLRAPYPDDVSYARTVLRTPAMVAFLASCVVTEFSTDGINALVTKVRYMIVFVLYWFDTEALFRVPISFSFFKSNLSQVNMVKILRSSWKLESSIL